LCIQKQMTVDKLFSIDSYFSHAACRAPTCPANKRKRRGTIASSNFLLYLRGPNGKSLVPLFYFFYILN
ncbi:MAG: hypothetical protein Q8881_02875, partial [Sweet potato little leaf phytoplasma]|nr:hypothetical protein [Sweet potato little leaf phytoplasma]